MRLVCLHADTVDALTRLRIQFDDLTPAGLWSSQYHLVGLTPEQFEALHAFQVEAEDITPAQLAQAAGDRKQATAIGASAAEPRTAPANQVTVAHGGSERPPVADRAVAYAPAADVAGRDPARAGPGSEAEVPLAQARDGGGRSDEGKLESKPQGAPAGQPAAQVDRPQGAAPTAQTGQQTSLQKGAKGSAPAAPPGQGTRKGQPAEGSGAASSGQRYGTTRLRISVAGKYTEATVANGKIVVAGRSFDSPDQAAAELTKSRGDWTFWEYYDSTDGKWRMLTRDWDTVLKSAAPGGR
jgi:hypothetical protein